MNDIFNDLLLGIFDKDEDLISIFNSAGIYLYRNASTSKFYQKHGFGELRVGDPYQESQFFPFINEALSFFKREISSNFYEQLLNLKNGVDIFLILSLERIVHNESVFFILRGKNITEIIKLKNDDNLKATQLIAISHILQHDLKSTSDDLTFILDYMLEYEHEYVKVLNNSEINILRFFKQALNKNRMISDALNEWLKFVNTGILHKEYINLTDLIKKVAKNNIRDNNIQIKVSNLLPTLLVNKSQIETLFDNLIKNAIKFNNKEKKKINVSYSKDKQALIVKDNGIGFPVDKLELLLKPFEKGTTEYSGMGLGLTICDQIIKNHGWKLEVESKRDIYTKVYIIV